MPGKLKLTTAEIDALIEARQPEPRSVRDGFMHSLRLDPPPLAAVFPRAVA